MLKSLIPLCLIVSSLDTSLSFPPVSPSNDVPIEVMEFRVPGDDLPIRLKCHEFAKKKTSGVVDIIWQYKRCGSGLSLISCDELRPDSDWEYAYCRNQTKLCTSSTLTIPYPKELDSGLYRCLHKNYMMQQYEVNRLVLLDVTDPSMEFMEMLPEEFDIDNQTVVENQTAVFRCRVRSILKPQIVWARQLEYYEYLESADFILDGVPLIFVSGTETYYGGNKLFTSKLYITNVSISDGGLYMCYAINEQKALLKKVSLIVKPTISLPSGAYFSDRSNVSSEIMRIALATLLCGMCCGLIFCLIFRRCFVSNAQQNLTECDLVEPSVAELTFS